MTVFLCILALIAVTSPPEVEIKGKGGGWWAAGALFAWVLLVLGLATLALYSHSGAVPW